MFRIALCDDSDYDLSLLLSYVGDLKEKKIYPETDIYRDGASLIEAYKSGRRYDAVVLDMLMEPMDGMTAARHIRTFDSHVSILIVTSTVSYALEGYQVNARRYLVKPVERELFLKEMTGIYEELKEDKPNVFTVSNDEGFVRVRYSDILYFESELHAITLHTAEKNHTFRGSLSDIENRLTGYGFFRCHKSFIINLRHIKTIFKNAVVMDDGSEVFLSKHRSAALYEAVLNDAEAQA